MVSTSHHHHQQAALHVGHGVTIQKMGVKGMGGGGGGQSWGWGRHNLGFFMTVVYFQCCCLSKNQTHKIVCKLLIKLLKKLNLLMDDQKVAAFHHTAVHCHIVLLWNAKQNVEKSLFELK